MRDEFRKLAFEMSAKFPGTAPGCIVRRGISAYYALRANEVNFSRFASEQIIPIVRSQCLAAANYLVASDDRLIDRELVKWYQAGKPKGMNIPWMAMLSNSDPDEALKVLRRYSEIVANRDKMKAVSNERYLLVDLWVAPSERGSSLSILSNDAVAAVIGKLLNKNPKAKSKQSELKKSLGLLSHTPPRINHVVFDEEGDA